MLKIVDENTRVVELIAEIEEGSSDPKESGVPPKKIIGDIVNVFLSDKIRIQGKDYDYGIDVAFVLGLKINPGGEGEEKAIQLRQKLLQVNEAMRKKRIDLVLVCDGEVTSLIAKVEAEIRRRLRVT